MKILTSDNLAYFVEKIKTWVSGSYVAKESGKGLSTNDYTTTEKNKLAGIANSAQVNVIETVKVNGTALTPSSKAVNIDLSAYATTSAVANTYAKKTDITAVLRYKGTKDTVSALPTSGNTTGDVWHVTADGNEYAWDGSAWEALGQTVDLSGYATKSSAITGLSVSGKVITYTKGDGTTGTITTQDTNTDTKNTAGSTNSSAKLFLIGATSQAASPQTYSHDTAYVGTDGKLYSGGKVVIASGDTATAATKATQDGSGNVITSTYATKSQLNSYVLSSNLVALTEAEIDSAFA